MNKADERIERGERMVKARRERAEKEIEREGGEEVHSTLMEGEQRGEKEKRNKVFYTAARVKKISLKRNQRLTANHMRIVE